MPKTQPLRTVIINRIRNSPKARKAIADIARSQGKSIDPENWKALLAFLESVFTQILPLILKFI